jgi:hypothetical protein
MVLDYELAIRSIVDFRDKAVTAPRYGSDEFVFAFSFAKYLSQRRDMNGEVIIFDKLIDPDPIKQLCAADNFPAFLYQN